MAIVNLTEAFNFCGIDDTDDAMATANMTQCIDAAEAYIVGVVGDEILSYFPGDSRLKQAVLLYCESLYNHDDEAVARRKVEGLIWQLQLKLQNAVEEAEPNV